MTGRLSDVAPDRDMTPTRRTAVRVLAVLGLLTYSLLFVFVAAEASGIVTSAPVGSPDDPAPSPEALSGAAAPGEAVHVVGAAGALVLGASGLMALVVHPQRRALARQVLAAASAPVVVIPLVGDPDNVGGQAAIIDPSFLVLATPAVLAALVARPFTGLTSVRRRPLLAILAALALPVVVWWGTGQALNQRNTFPPAADPHHQAHWHVMAVFAFAVVFVVAAAALDGRGWRLGAVTSGLSAAAFAVTSLAAPDAASAISRAWSVTVLAWGLAVLSSVGPGRRVVEDG